MDIASLDAQMDIIKLINHVINVNNHVLNVCNQNSIAQNVQILNNIYPQGNVLIIATQINL